MMADEIKSKAGELGIPPDIVEKDYVISTVLREIWISGVWKNLVFKGGTSLKKTYFPNYRFSEDLDFNLLDGDAEGLTGALSGLKGYAGEIEFLEPEIRERLGKRYHAGKLVGYEIRIPYRFLRKSGVPAKIRIDLSVGDYEKMVLPPVERKIFHNYSDEGAFSSVRIMTYSLEEIMAEKIRSIFQRTGRPRDIYDIWYLSGHADMDLVLSVIEEKFEAKGVPFSLNRVLDNEGVYRSNWRNMKILVGDVPDFDAVWDAVTEVCEEVKEVIG